MWFMLGFLAALYFSASPFYGILLVAYLALCSVVGFPLSPQSAQFDAGAAIIAGMFLHLANATFYATAYFSLQRFGSAAFLSCPVSQV